MLWLPHQDGGVGQEEEKSPASWTSTPSISQTKWGPASIPFSPTHCGLRRPKWRPGSLPSSSSTEVKWRGGEWSWLLVPGVCRVHQGAELSPSRSWAESIKDQASASSVQLQSGGTQLSMYPYTWCQHSPVGAEHLRGGASQCPHWSVGPKEKMSLQPIILQRRSVN